MILNHRHVQGWNEALEAAAQQFDSLTFRPYEHPSKAIRALKIDAPESMLSSEAEESVGLDTLDWNRLRSGDRRPLNPDNQALFDAYYANERDAARYRWLREHWEAATGLTWRDPPRALDAWIDQERSTDTNSESVVDQIARERDDWV